MPVPNAPISTEMYSSFTAAVDDPSSFSICIDVGRFLSFGIPAALGIPGGDDVGVACPTPPATAGGALPVPDATEPPGVRGSWSRLAPLESGAVVGSILAVYGLGIAKASPDDDRRIWLTTS